MKKIYFTFIGICMLVLSAWGQSYLSPTKNYKANNIFPSYNTLSAFDIYNNLMYANDGDTIRCFDIKTGKLLSNKYGKPASYAAWPSFVTVSPDGKRIWAGFTNNGNIDDRIYVIDINTGTWTLKAKLSGNFDLEFLNGKVLVSGLNSSDWSSPNSIFLLDTTGTDNHKKIVEIGGNSAGFATDATGNIYYGTYLMYATPPKPDGLYRWDSNKVAGALSGFTYLTLDDGTFLSKLPNGAYDCEVDAGGNLFFNSNNFASPGFIAKWNGTIGNTFNYDTLAITPNSDWITFLKATGDVLKPEKGGKLYTLAFAQPIAEVQHKLPPVVTKSIATINGLETDANVSVDLSSHFSDPDAAGLSYEIALNSNSAVANASVNSTNLVIDFLAAGQTTIVVKAISSGLSVSDTFLVGVRPTIEGNYVVSNFENLTLAPNSYWNGDDGKGSFVTGLAKLINNYDPSYGSWSGFGYSNMANDSSASFANQYSAITAMGVDTTASKGRKYGAAYVPVAWWTPTSENVPISMKFADSTSHQVKGFYVTNNTYAALSMEQGDFFAKKFGGVSGNDPDWFKLSVWGIKNGSATDTIDFYLADYRSADNSKDYIVKTWQWVDLSSLGKVDSLKFVVNSTDVGMYGMNTPGYFCVDNIFIVPNAAPVVANPIADITVKTNAENKVIDLSNVFSDVDDDNSLITKSIVSNSNTNVISASITGNSLTIDFLAEGTSKLVIKGLSNGKAAYDTIQVKVIADQSPFVANPIADVSVIVNTQAKEVDLTNVFGDADNDVTAIVKTVLSNTNTGLVSTNLLGNALTLTFVSSQTGTAYIIIKAQSGDLSVTDTFKVNVTPATGVSNVMQPLVSIYPNPSNGKLTINIGNNNAANILVVDLRGTIVYQNQQYSSGALIDISNLSAGNYLVKVQQGQTTICKSIIKQ